MQESQDFYVAKVSTNQEQRFFVFHGQACVATANSLEGLASQIAKLPDFSEITNIYSTVVTDEEIAQLTEIGYSVKAGLEVDAQEIDHLANMSLERLRLRQLSEFQSKVRHSAIIRI